MEKKSFFTDMKSFIPSVQDYSFLKIIVWTILILVCNLPAYGQTYEALRDSGLRAYDALKFEDAIKQFEAAEVLAEYGRNAQQIAEADSLVDWAKDGYIDAIFLSRKNAEEARNEAEKASREIYEQLITLRVSNMLPKYHDRGLRIIESLWRGRKIQGLGPTPLLSQTLAELFYHQLKKGDEPGRPIPVKYFKGEVLLSKFAPNGKLFFTALKDSTIKLWNLKGQLLVNISLDSEIDYVDFFPNGKFIIANSTEEKSLKSWDLDGNLVFETTYKGHSPKISPNGNYFYTISSNQRPRYIYNTVVELYSSQGHPIARLNAHKYRINSVVFSSEEDLILTASDDATAKLWNSQGELLADLKGHKGQVSTANFSPNEKMVLTVSRDNTVKVWNLEGKLIADLTKHKRRITTACFSPNGKLILTASEDGSVKVWDLKGRILNDLPIDDGVVETASFSPDGQLVLTGSRNGMPKVWSLEGNLLFDLNSEEVKSSISFVDFSPNGELILARGKYSSQITIWNLNGELIKILDKHAKSIEVIELSPSSHRYIISVDKNQSAIFWDLNGILTSEFGHEGKVYSAVFSPDQTREILTSSTDGTARLWASDGNLLANMNLHDGPVTTAIFSPDGEAVLTGSEDKTVKLWNRDGTLVEEFKKHKRAISTATFSRDGKHILTCAEDATAMIWSSDGSIIAELNIVPLEEERYAIRGGFPVYAIFSPNGKFVATHCNNFTRIWNKDGTLRTEIPKGSDISEFFLAFSPDSKYLLTMNSDETRIWDVNGNLLSEVTSARNLRPDSKAYFSQEKGLILIYSYKEIILWNYLTNQFLLYHRVPGEVPTSAMINNSKRVVLATFTDGSTRVWDFSGNLISDFKHQNEYLDLGIFSNDANFVATASTDYNVVRYSDVDGQLLAVLDRHISRISTLQFSSDDKYILTASSDGTAKLWPTPQTIYEWLQSPDCPIPPLTEEERIQYNLIED